MVIDYIWSTCERCVYPLMIVTSFQSSAIRRNLAMIVLDMPMKLCICFCRVDVGRIGASTVGDTPLIPWAVYLIPYRYRSYRVSDWEKSRYQSQTHHLVDECVAGWSFRYRVRVETMFIPLAHGCSEFGQRHWLLDILCPRGCSVVQWDWLR